MPNSVLVAFGLESVFIFITTLALTQPKFLFRMTSPALQNLVNWVGMFLLCATFCWSVVLGIVLSMNDITLQF
jgi:hypothetical protein